MCAYVCPSVRMYLSVSCVRVSMLPFVCVHAGVREGVCVSPSVRFDRTSLRSSMHTFVCLHARVREGVCLSPPVRPSVCPRACSCVQMFVRTCVRPSMHARPFLFLTSNFFIIQLLTSNFHVCTWVFASVRTCVRMALRQCVCT